MDECQRSATSSVAHHEKVAGVRAVCPACATRRAGVLLITSERGILYHAARVGSLSLPCVARRAF